MKDSARLNSYVQMGPEVVDLIRAGSRAPYAYGPQRQKGNEEKVDRSAAVQGAIAGTWEYTEEDYVFAFGEAVIAAVQRPETHICIDSGASRSPCLFGYAPDVTQHGHCFRSMGLQLSNVGTRRCTGRNVIRFER